MVPKPKEKREPSSIKTRECLPPAEISWTIRVSLTYMSRVSGPPPKLLVSFYDIMRFEEAPFAGNFTSFGFAVSKNSPKPHSP